MKSQRDSQAGMTLIEVMVSLAVFSIGALGVLGMVTTSLHQTATARNNTEATQIGIWKMEQFQTFLLTDTNINGTTGTFYWAKPGALKSSSVNAMAVGDLAGPAGGTQYQVRWMMDSPATNLRHYTVEVSWPRDRQVQGLAAGATGFVDCSVTPVACRRLVFHTYR